MVSILDVLVMAGPILIAKVILDTAIGIVLETLRKCHGS